VSAIPFFSVLIIPACVGFGFVLGGLSSFLTIVLVFGLIPILDALIGLNTSNPAAADEKALAAATGYQLLTWLCAAVQVALVLWGVALFAGTALTIAERLGLILSLGICSGGMGIVVSHELIHRIDNRLEPLLGRIALASVLYLHWAIEHIAGHHRTVATPEDPATARKNESYYAFWPRTVFGGIQSAWDIEAGRLRRRGKSAFRPANRLLRYAAIEILLISLVLIIFGWKGVIGYVAQALVAISLLELVNYIEHYGLQRRKENINSYEPVRSVHSWNAAHRLTNYLLFNLQRHPDHHKRPARRYQTLRHFEKSPQLPAGYATMVLLALCPPLWFKIMNPRIPHFEKSREK